LELGFGKEIQDILNLLGSTKTGLNDQGNEVPRPSKFQRQNLLLSATLNEKVNHLAKISLEDPVMIGIDDKIMKPTSNIRFDNSDSDEDNEDRNSSKIQAVGAYKVPEQLIQRYLKGM
jgi:ATP-dependent RNA helicase DDX31/DBP7